MKHKGLVPYAHVANVNRSVEFYKKLGFEIGNSHPSDSPEPIWVWLHAGGANLMIAATGPDEPVIASQQAIFFYLYVEDVASFRNVVIAAGIDAGPLQHPFYLPLGEFIVHDPDGYAVMIAQHD